MEKEKIEKQSFVMYNSFIDAAANLDDAHFKECVLKIRDYALYGKDDRSEHIGVNIILDMAKPLLDAARLRYEKKHNKKPKDTLKPNE